MKTISADSPIGIYDSGVGGLTVWRAVRELLPAEKLIYFADQAKVPYGSRPLDEVRELAVAACAFLMDQGCKLIVIACNTASAAALKHVRAMWPDFPFVGMEPAVKPAAEQTLSGKVGVLATTSTLHGALYASVVERFANDVQLYQATCPGLVQQIEKGLLDAPETRRILKAAVEPMLEEGVDTLVMGCTHFPFVIPLIKQIAGESVRVIDPAPAVAKQVRRVLESRDLLVAGEGEGESLFYTSGEPEKMQALLPKLIGREADVVRKKVAPHPGFADPLPRGEGLKPGG